MGRWPPFFSHWASFPEVVVFPDPCSPAMRMTVGGWGANLNLAVSWPRTSMSSSRTILTICSEGERAVATSAPRALARMWSTTSRAMSRLTSASRSAVRMERRASLMFSSVRVPWPRRSLKARWSLSLRFSNMAVLSLSCGEEMEAEGEMGGSGRAWREAHLSDDEPVAKMGHPFWGRAGGVR